MKSGFLIMFNLSNGADILGYKLILFRPEGDF
jgi:hypothetical protein